jgi:GMP synthase (glutamine-hydrolysing)
MIIVIDYGSQYNELIARRVRECSVYSELVPHDIKLSELKAKAPQGIILSGGPNSVYDKDSPGLPKGLLELNVPILGICYGMQLLGQELGGKVAPASGKREYGRTDLVIDDRTDLFEGLPEKIICWMSHGDSVTHLPKGFHSLAHTDSVPIAAFGDTKRHIYGVQFHPEVVHTQKGMEMVRNFVHDICKARPEWTMAGFIERSIKEIREKVGKEKVLLGLSGGVDSTTVAALLHKAVGDQLICMFIDQGFMRKNEAEQIVKMIAKHFQIKLIHVNAAERFYEKIAGVTDPEQKRKIIGNEFVRVFESESKKLGDFGFLAQGTLYPDVIESAVKGDVSKAAAKIKTHHNVGGLPDDMKFKLIEPMRMLFKDEVRKLGLELGLPEEIIWRQPFPGPGLAIRILGEVTPERVKMLQEADDIVVSEIKNAGLYRVCWQSFAVLLPIKTVGVMGDQRTYQNTVAVRAVTSEDAMTASWAELPYELLGRISSRIINEVSGVNRVVYDISSKPPSTIEWE